MRVVISGVNCTLAKIPSSRLGLTNSISQEEFGGRPRVEINKLQAT